MTGRIVAGTLIAMSVCVCLAQAESDSDSILFAPPVYYEAGAFPNMICCGDFDGDFDQDFAVVNNDGQSITVWMNMGNGTFGERADYPSLGDCTSICGADLNADSDIDLVITDEINDLVSIYWNDGSGVFSVRDDYPVGDNPFSAFVSDLDGDLHPDIAVANGYSDDISILINNGDGTFQPKVDYPGENQPTRIHGADLDGDSDIDLAVANYYSDYASVYFNNGDGSFQSQIAYEISGGLHHVICVDFDKDGDNDLLFMSAWDDCVIIYSNAGDGAFSFTAQFPVGERPTGIDCADLDNDGDLDVVTANLDGHSLTILNNDGTGNLDNRYDIPMSGDPLSIFCADFDGDGDFDLAETNRATDNAAILINETAILVGWWKFDEGSGSIAYDSSGYANNGLLANGPIWTAGITGTALGFDGIDDYVNCGNDISLDLIDDLSILVWVKFACPPSSIINMVSKDEGWGWKNKWTFNYIHNYASISDALGFHINDPGGSEVWVKSDTWTPATDRWYHLALEKRNNLFQFYVDGSSLGSDSSATPLPHVDFPLLIGRAEESFHFPGVIDELKLYKGAVGKSFIKREFSRRRCGDANADGTVNVSDAVFVAAYIFSGGEVPNIYEAADVNCDETVNISDAVYLINYVFIGGNNPCDPDGDGLPDC